MIPLEKKDYMKKCISPETDRFIEYSMSISHQLIDYMTEHKLTKYGLAKKVGIKNSCINDWLSGKNNFTIRTLALIETKLNIKLKIMD
jgi:hypothetical protein